MGSSNQHIYRGGSLSGYDKLCQKDMMFGLNKDAYTPMDYGFPSDLNKTNRSGVDSFLPNELIKIDPSDPTCIGANYIDGVNVPTLNNLGSVGGSSTITANIPTLQFPKVNRISTSPNRFEIYTAPMLAFNLNQVNASTFTFGNTSTLASFHRLNGEYSIYFVYSARQNAALNSFAPPSTPTSFQSGILFTTPNSGGIGLQLILENIDSSLVLRLYSCIGVSITYSINSIIPLIYDYRNLQYPIVVSLVGKNVQDGSDIAWVYVNGKKAGRITWAGNPFSTSNTSTTAPCLFKRNATTGNLVYNMNGGVGDLRIFNVRHDEETHQDIVQMLMKKYRIV